MQKLSLKLQELKQFVNILILLFLQPSCETLAWVKILDYSKKKQNTWGGGVAFFPIYMQK